MARIDDLFGKRRTATEARIASRPERPEETSALQREQLQHVLDAMTDAVIAVGAGGRVTIANPAAKRVLGVAPDSLIGSSLKKAVGSAGLVRVVDEARERALEVEDEVELTWPVRRRLHVRAVPLTQDEGVVAVITDVSRPRRVEQIRRDFVANVSHELKTPVAGLTLLAESLQAALSSGDRETADRFAASLVAEAERLRALTNDLLTLSKIESLAPSAPEQVDLAAIVDEVVRAVSPHAVAKGLAIRTVLDPALGPLTGSKHDFRVLVQNLVDNAVRYTDAGSVTVSLRQTADGVVLEVKDTGIGTPPKDLARVFERFYRVEKSRARHTGGTGLGLSIVRHIADAYGLSVRLDSTEDAGTTIAVTFPASTP